MSAATHVLVIDPNDVDRHYYAQRSEKVRRTASFWKRPQVRLLQGLAKDRNF